MPNMRGTKGISTDPKIENQKELGLKIKDSRLKKGLTQEQLAIRLSCSVESIRSLELGRILYHPPYFSKLLKFLNIDEK